MRSRPRWRSSSPSGTDLLALAVAGLALGCGGGDGEECGPGGEPADGVSVTSAGEAIRFDEFVSSPNNDCTPPGDGPTSLSVQGAQIDTDETGFLILCLPRPDELGGGPIALSDADRVQVIDLVGRLADGCELDLDRERPLSGEIAFSGVCDDGTHPDGYAMTLAATVPLARTCPGGAAEAVEAEVAGRAAVSVPLD